MIRDVSDCDIAQVVDIYNYYILNSTATFEETEIDVPEMSDRILKVNMQGFLWLVAVENDEVTGYAYAGRWNNRSAYRYTVEVTIYLKHTVVCRGTGTMLYTELFSKLRALGTHTAIAGITLPNPASIALHEKFGMIKAGHFRDVGYKFGRWLDVGYWDVQLNA